MRQDRIFDVKVVAGAKKDLVSEDPLGLKVYLRAPAVDGRANEALVGVLAQHFDVDRVGISIIKGLKSRRKVIKISPVS